MPGTIAIIEAEPLFFNSRDGRFSGKTYRVSVDGAVAGQFAGQPGTVDVEPGTHSVQVSIGRFRTNTVAVTVIEGGHHTVLITPHVDSIARHFGLIGLLIGVAWPGSCWRAKISSSPAEPSGTQTSPRPRGRHL